jgi:predicted O-methyltransferase YrrM
MAFPSWGSMADYSSPMRNRIIDLYGERMLKRSVISIRGGAGVIPELLAGKGYRTALEIGTYRGVGAAEMSPFVDRVVTIDLKYGRMEQLKENHDRYAFWRSLGIDNITFYAVHDDAEKARLVDSIDFDFALIDGAHDESVRKDFELVKRCGRVLFHDCDRRGSEGKDHVIDFVESLPKEQMKFMDIFGFWRG